ncbi:uncharacterized protein LOC123321144 [Coccinella septempunctata]|uniref:uncharacterized protein LOC123321144 n=1 Tax=Coccinella septempunctata TaxID=41139 RepID=UPI001D076A10|nr:uncharacterized protein LOC123321144 [Coccinella septempunctata]
MILVWITLLSYLIQICYGSVLIDCNNKGFICYDRTRFYQCVEIGNSTFVIGSPQECPPGLICDDLSDLECDEPENIPTTKRVTTRTTQTTPAEEISTSTTNSETSESETSAGTSTIAPTSASTRRSTTRETTETEPTSTSQPDFTCYNVGKYPDPQSCTKFHVCVNAIFGLIDVPYDCPDGTQYDSVNQECTIDPVQCPWEPQLECEKAGIYKNPYYCGRYYRCTWRYAYNRYEIKQFRCPDFTEFNQEMGKCVKSDTCQQNQTDFQCIQAGKFPVQENCKEYYECTKKGEGYVEKRKSCPIYQLFDRNLGRCRNECLVKCPVEDEETEMVEGKVFLKELLSRE